uniref:Uncharacterized protein n=1 Tax=Pseudomonas phage HRDY3 TaxID=3236930 RepID=A0AB39CE12_9VIRU
MIEIYIDNRGNPARVEETVNTLGLEVIGLEHADEVSCVQLPNSHGIENLYVLDVMYVRTAEKTELHRRSDRTGQDDQFH